MPVHNRRRRTPTDWNAALKKTIEIKAAELANLSLTAKWTVEPRLTDTDRYIDAMAKVLRDLQSEVAVKTAKAYGGARGAWTA